jgi:hypothetical protein
VIDAVLYIKCMGGAGLLALMLGHGVAIGLYVNDVYAGVLGVDGDNVHS